MGIFTIGWGIIHSAISSTIVLLIVKVFPQGIAHKLVFVFSMLYIMIR